MRNLKVVNIHPRGLTSHDVRDFLWSDSADVMDGCRRSFLSVCACKAVARRVPYYMNHPLWAQFALGPFPVVMVCVSKPDRIVFCRPVLPKPSSSITRAF